MRFNSLVATSLLCGMYFLASAQQRIASYEEVKKEHWTYRRFDNDPMNVRVYTLENGLTVITSLNKSQPRISTMIAVKAGSKNDPSDHTGLAHYLEHMLFKGTNKYGTVDFETEKSYLAKIDDLYDEYNSTKDTNLRKRIYYKIDSVSQLAAKYAIANEYDKMCQAMGASGTNAFTSNEMTVYVNDIPSNMLHKWLLLESERFRMPILRLFHTELEAVYEEKNISLDKDQSKVNEQLYAALFPNHNYGQQTTIGTIEHLKNPSLKAIRDYYYQHYVPNNMAIILSGDFDPDAAVDGIYEHFKWMKPKPVPTYQYKDEMISLTPKKIEILGSDAEWITIGFRLPGAGTREARIAKMIDLLLNNSSAGLIDINLVKKQAVVSANSGVNVLNDYSIFTLSGKPKEGQTLEQVRDLLLQQMALIRNGSFDKEMLKAILLNEEVNKIKGYKQNENRMYFLLEAFTSNLGYQKAYNELWEMAKITKEEIMEVAAEYLDRDRVEVYKRIGEDKNVTKIIKPQINPVELNRDKQSEFLVEWMNEESNPIEPVFVNFQEQLIKNKIGPCNYYYTKNSENRLFQLVLKFEMGKYHSKTLSTVFEYLRIVGTKTMSADSFSKRMYQLACSYGFSAGAKESFITLSGPEDNLKSALELLNQLLTNPEENQEKLNTLILNQLKRRNDMKLSKNAIYSMLNQYVQYGENNPARFILKNNELKNLTTKDILNTLQIFKNQSQDIIYYGRMSSSDFSDIVGQVISFPKEFNNSLKPANFIKRDNENSQVYFVNYPTMVQANIYWLKKSTSLNIEDHALIELFNQYFGGDMSSVVFQNIREAKALAYSTFAGYLEASEKDEPNTVLGFIGTQADKFSDATAAMEELFQQLPIDTMAIETAKMSILSKIESERILPEDLIYYFYDYKKLGVDYDLRESVYKKVGSLTAADLQKFHLNNFANKKFMYAIVADKTLVTKEMLSKLGEVKELSVDEIFGFE